MAMVLTPILKAPVSSTMTQGKSESVRGVTFNLPADEESIIQYFQENESATPASKLGYIIRKIYSPDAEDSILLKWITEFKNNIFFLDQSKEPITKALLNLPWYKKDDTFVAAYQELILNLVTAHSFYLRKVLLAIISIFMKVSGDKESIDDEERQSLNHTHALARRIIQVVPMSDEQLYTLLIEKFPYYRNTAPVLLHYVENLFEACTYLPRKKHLIMECIFGKIIQMDVDCSKDVIQQHEFDRQEQLALLMEIDSTTPQQVDEMAYPLANTLDMLMNCLFVYINKRCFVKGGELNWDATKKLYKELLTVFDKVILPTVSCCHLQYVLFYICSLKPELSEGFLDYLWKKVQNPNVSPVFRQTSAFYIGSFLSRAKYINISTVTACFDLMCNWIHRYIDMHCAQDADVHGTFHSVCQTLFYVFAFRNKELLKMKGSHKYLQSLNFDRIVSCRLNPLRYCDRTIVQNFASIARNHQIAYVYPILEKNNRNLLYSSFYSYNEDAVCSAMISTFFPFDPYLLKRSKHWVESDYRTYNHNTKEDDSLEINEDEDMCVNEELFSYSMSPGFKKSIQPRFK